MTKEMEMRLHRIFNIILTVFIILTALCLMAGCLRIYFNVTFEPSELFGGITLPAFYPDQDYSREIVKETFSYIAVPVYATIALVLFGFVYEFISPLAIKKKKVNKDNENLAKRLSRKKNVAGGVQDSKAVSALYNIKLKRSVYKWVLAGVWTVFSAVFFVYAVMAEHYTENINVSVINAFLILISCIAIPFGYSVFYIHAMEKSFEKEVEILKKLPDAREDKIAEEEEKESREIPYLMFYVLVGAAIVALLSVGIYLGGYDDVLTKAVNICTECIGLG